MAPICAQALGIEVGIKQDSRVVVIRITSSRLYSTLASRALRLSSLPKIQGVVSSIYLLALEITLKISARALFSWVSSM